MAMSGLTPMKNLLRITAYLILAAAISPISQLTLAPSFGAIPSSVHHATMVAVTFSLGLMLASKRSLARPSLLANVVIVLLFYIPLLQYWLHGSSTHLGPVGGPILNGLLSCHIAIVLAGYEAELSLRRLQLDLWAMPNAMASFLLLGLLLAVFWPTERLLQQNLSALLLSLRMTPSHLQLGHATLFAAAAAAGGTSPAWLAALATPGALHTVFINPHTSTARVNAELWKHQWSLLERRWSVTGYLAVLENHEQGYRVLRCDHSLLGGEWLLTERRRQHEGWLGNEPTYAVFEMLEAVRLVERKEKNIKRDGAEERALVIGLGIGTAPKALIAHGINTTVVELDPVVHELATRYFDLPAGRHRVIIQDAVEWVAQQQQQESRSEPGVAYDYIIHDVFTGGASPRALFEEPFLRSLRSLLAPDGIIALNYAGDLALPLTHRALNTVERVFDGRSQCKIYRDGPPPPPPPPPLSVVSSSKPQPAAAFAASSSSSSSSHLSSSLQEDSKGGYARESRAFARGAEKPTVSPKRDEEKHPPPQAENASEGGDFANLVVFCRNNADGGPITFRSPIPADFLGSKSRQHYLLPKQEHEMPFPSVVNNPSGSTDSDGDGRVPASLDRAAARREWAWQIEGAIRHWRIMRDVLPSVIWDLW